MRFLLYSCVVTVVLSGDCSSVDCDGDNLDGDLYNNPADVSGSSPKDCCKAKPGFKTGSGDKGVLVTGNNGLEVADDGVATCESGFSADGDAGTFAWKPVIECLKEDDGTKAAAGDTPWTHWDYTDGEWTSNCKKDKKPICSAYVVTAFTGTHARYKEENLPQGQHKCTKTVEGSGKPSPPPTTEWVVRGTPDKDATEASGNLFCSKDDGNCENDKVFGCDTATPEKPCYDSNNDAFNCDTCFDGSKKNSDNLCEPCGTAGVLSYDKNYQDTDSTWECPAKTCGCGYEFVAGDSDTKAKCDSCSRVGGQKSENVGDGGWLNCGKDCTVDCDHDQGYYPTSDDLDCTKCSNFSSEWDSWALKSDACEVKSCKGGSGYKVNDAKDDCEECDVASKSDVKAGSVTDNDCDWECDEGFKVDSSDASTPCEECAHAKTSSSTGVAGVDDKCAITCSSGFKHNGESKNDAAEDCDECVHGQTWSSAGLATVDEKCKITCDNGYYLDDSGEDANDECKQCDHQMTDANASVKEVGNDCKLTCADGYHDKEDQEKGKEDFYSDNDCVANQTKDDKDGLSWNDGCKDQTTAGAKTGDAAGSCCDDYVHISGKATVLIKTHDKDQDDKTICEKDSCLDNQIVVDRTCENVGGGRIRKSGVSGWKAYDPADSDADWDSKDADLTASEEETAVYNSWAVAVDYTGGIPGFQFDCFDSSGKFAAIDYTLTAKWGCNQERGFVGTTRPAVCADTWPAYDGAKESDFPRYELVQELGDECPDDEDKTKSCHQTLRNEKKDGVATGKMGFFGTCMDGKWYKLDNPFPCADADDAECLDSGMATNSCGDGLDFAFFADSKTCKEHATSWVDTFAQTSTVSSSSDWSDWRVTDDATKCPDNDGIKGGCGIDAVTTDKCDMHFKDSKGDRKTWRTQGDDSNEDYYVKCSADCESFYKNHVTALEQSCTNQAAAEMVVKAATAANPAFPTLVEFAGLVALNVGLSVQQVIDVVNHKDGDTYTFGQSSKVHSHHGRYAATLFWNDAAMAKVESIAGDFSFLDSATVAKLKAAMEESMGATAKGTAGASSGSTLYTVLALVAATIFAL